MRSMAILFKLPDGEEWRTGMNNIPVFLCQNRPGISRSVASVGRRTRRPANPILPE